MHLSDRKGSTVRGDQVWHENGELTFWNVTPSVDAPMQRYETKTIPWDAIGSGSHVYQVNVLTDPTTKISCAPDTESTKLQCHNPDPRVPNWAVTVMSVLAGFIALAGLVYTAAVWRRWAVPGVGIVGCPMFCVCSTLFSLWKPPSTVFDLEEIKQVIGPFAEM